MGAVMYALIRLGDNKASEIVESTEGYDLKLYRVVPVEGDPHSQTWNGSEFVAKPPSKVQLSRSALAVDPVCARLGQLSPSEIGPWLQTNMTDLASARRVMEYVLLSLAAGDRGR